MKKDSQKQALYLFIRILYKKTKTYTLIFSLFSLFVLLKNEFPVSSNFIWVAIVVLGDIILDVDTRLHSFLFKNFLTAP